MEIKYVFYIWFLLIAFGLTLILIRKDLDSVKREGVFVMQKGLFYHKLIYVIIVCILLPFTIPYSIIKLTRK
jgi:hypothetical protein